MQNATPDNQPKGQDQAFLSRTVLSDTFLEALVAEIDTEQMRGMILGGSHARGDATPYSDVDLACFVPDSFRPWHSLRYHPSLHGHGLVPRGLHYN
jgi:UTP:GlnB (protein PII) uridylyltransferase